MLRVLLWQNVWDWVSDMGRICFGIGTLRDRAVRGVGLSCGQGLS